MKIEKIEVVPVGTGFRVRAIGGGVDWQLYLVDGRFMWSLIYHYTFDTEAEARAAAMATVLAS